MAVEESDFEAPILELEKRIDELSGFDGGKKQDPMGTMRSLDPLPYATI